jgi:CheY-like chemotaxis protein
MTALNKMRLLLVDDNLRNLALLERVLATDGFTEVLSTENGTAVPWLCDRHRPDLVLLDQHMPEITGFDAQAGAAPRSDALPDHHTRLGGLAQRSGSRPVQTQK